MTRLIKRMMAGRNVFRARIVFMISGLVIAGMASLGMFIPTVRADAGLVAHWAFSDGSGTTIADSSGNGNNATIQGTPDWVSGGVNGQPYALSFDGSDNYATIGTVANPPASQMTLCGWIKTSSKSPQTILAINRRLADTSNEGIFGTVQGGSLQFWDYSTSIGFTNQTSNESSIPVADGHWHFACFVKNGTSGTYYVDGVQAGTVTAAQDVSYGASNWVIGADVRDNDNYFNGLMDDMRVYNIALTQQQIAGLTGLVGYWKFDDGSGTSAIDSSGNNNTGTLFGSPTWTTGKIGGALQFGGDQAMQYVSIGDSTISPAIASTGEMTGTAWVYPTSSVIDGSIVKSWPTDSGNDQFKFGFNASSGSLSLSIKESNGTVIGPVVDPNPLPLNQWDFVAFTADGTNVNVYVNGTNVASMAYNGTLHSGGNYIGIGAELDDGGGPPSTAGFFDGTIDDVHLYNRALTPDELAVFTESVPGQVTGLQAAGTYSSGFDLSWNANPVGDAVTDYEVQYSTDSGNTWTTVDTSSTNTSYTLTGLSPGDYLFEVFAVNGVGNGAPSSSQEINSPVQTYDISDCAALENIANTPGDAVGNYVLTNNIDCSGIPNFVPINFPGGGFAGTFNGNNYTISNLTIDTTQTSGTGGLFESATGATFENVNFNGGSVAGNYDTGVLAGQAISATISGVTSNIGVSSVPGSSLIGGIVGYADDSAFTDVTSSGDVAGDYSVGGIVGEADSSTISGAAASGSVTADDTYDYAAGGLVGYAYDDEIDHSAATGAVTGDGGVGGLVGDAGDEAGLTIAESFATGTVSGGVDIGGLVGSLAPTGQVNASILNSFATGTVQENQTVYDVYNDFGGLVGQATDATVSNSYYAGSIAGASNIGGLIGEANQVSIADSFSAVSSVLSGGSSAAVVGNDDDSGGYNSGPQFSDVLFDASQSTVCDATYGGTPSGCTAVNTSNADPDYFLNTTTVAPFTNGSPVWDFTDTWQTVTDGYPVLTGVGVAPTVVSVTPTDGSTDQATNVQGSITFSEPMDPTSLTMDVTSCDGGECPVALGWSDDNTVLGFIHMPGDYPEGVYTVTVNANSANGTPMAQSYSYSFTVGTPPVPTVVSVTPANNATGQPVFTPLTVTFSEAMDPTSVVVETSPCGQNSCVSYSQSWNSDDTVLTLQNQDLFLPNTTYTVGITRAKSSEEAPLASTYSWSFTTSNAALPVLTQVNPIPSTVTIPDAVYTFSNTQSDGNYLFTEVHQENASGQVGVHMDPTTHEVTFTGLQPGGTYSTSFQFIGDGGISNTLDIGPFTIGTPSSSSISGGGCPTALGYVFNPATFACSRALSQVSVPASSPAVSSAATYHFTRTLKFGMKGDDVVALQTFLKVTPVASKVFGPQTRRALISYQKLHSLTPDGIAGPKTEASIEGSM